MHRLARVVLRRVTPGRLALVGLAGVALLLPFGALAAFTDRAIPAFDFNGEKNVASVFSALLLVVAAVSAVLWGTGTARRRSDRVVGLVLGALFLFMAADEAGQLHEKAEFHTGIDWQVLYLPVFAAAGITAVLLVRAFRPHRAHVMTFLLGAALWTVAEYLELIQYDALDRRVAGYDTMVFFEEGLEMVGTVLFATALVASFRAAAAASGLAPAPALEPSMHRRVS